MKHYVLTLLAASLVAAAVELITPKGEGGRLVAHVRMVAGLFLLVALLVPLREGITLLRDTADGDVASRVEGLIPEAHQADYEAVFGESLAAMGEGEVKAWVLETLESHFGIPPSGCAVSVDCTYEADTLAVSEVKITLMGAYGLQDPHPIEDRISTQLHCACFVTVGSP